MSAKVFGNSVGNTPSITEAASDVVDTTVPGLVNVALELYKNVLQFGGGV